METAAQMRKTWILNDLWHSLEKLTHLPRKEMILCAGMKTITSEYSQKKLLKKKKRTRVGSIFTLLSGGMFVCMHVHVFSA